KTVAVELAETAEQVVGALRVLEAHSSIHNEPTRTIPGQEVPGLFGRTRVVGGGVSMGSSWWNSLPPDGVRAQAAALDRYRHFAAVVRVLLHGQPDKTLKKFEESDRIILGAIQQTAHPRAGKASTAFAEAVERLGAQAALVNSLYDPRGGSVVIVPDTNALIFNPALEEWRLDGLEPFTLMLLPTVLGEVNNRLTGLLRLRWSAR